MNKKLLAFVAFVFTFGIAFAQVTADPQDDFYLYAQSWELKKYVKTLPQLRPYPLNVVKSILTSVIEKGSERDVQIAKKYWEKITGKRYYVNLEGGIRQELNYDIYKNAGNEKEKSKTRQYNGGPHIAGDIAITPLASFGYNFGIYSVNEDDISVLPLFNRSEHDTVADSTEIGPFRLNIDMNSNLAIGKENIYMQAGINRSGFGPFLKDDLVLSDNAFHSPNLSFTYDSKRWSYTQIMQSIGASLNNGKDLDSDSQVGKYLALHSFRYRLASYLDVTYYESTVFGKRFELAYLLPAPFMAIQGIGDSTDNTQMGLLIEFSPISGFKWSNNFFADDIPLNDIMKLHFDTKTRVGIESGLQYSPEGSSLDLMTFNYTIIAPYTYAHWSYNDDGKTFSDTSYNYFNYVNRGIQIGASIPPNSDRIAFSARFTPVKRVNMTLKTSFARHANPYESLSDKEAEKIYKTNYYSRRNGEVYVKASNGTPLDETEYHNAISAGGKESDYLYINTDGGDVYCTNSSAFAQQKLIGSDNHVDTAWDHLNLLNQDHVMTIVQAGLDLAYETPKTDFGTFTFKFGWTWEYITNNGVQNSIYSAHGRTSDDYRAAYDDWVTQLHDSINNYLSFSVKVAY